MVASVDAAAMLALYQGVIGYVSACFAREAALVVEIDALTEWRAVAAFDVTAGWP